MANKTKAQLEQENKDLMAKVEELDKQMSRTRVAPVISRNIKEPMEAEMGGDDEKVRFDANNDSQIEIPNNKDIENPWKKQQMDMLAFFKLPVKIHIHEVHDQNADAAFTVGVNGEEYTFERNREYTVPRYVVEGLLRARPISYTCKPIVDVTGVEDYEYVSKTGLRYPFSIVEDNHPLGESWYKATLAQQA